MNTSTIVYRPSFAASASSFAFFFAANSTIHAGFPVAGAATGSRMGTTTTPAPVFAFSSEDSIAEGAPVSYTHLRAHET